MKVFDMDEFAKKCANIGFTLVKEMQAANVFCPECSTITISPDEGYVCVTVRVYDKEVGVSYFEKLDRAKITHTTNRTCEPLCTTDLEGAEDDLPFT